MQALEPPVADERVVVVVDDDKGVRAGLCNLLRSAGYQASSFESAESFLMSANLNTLDCLIIDYQLDGMTGVELHRQLSETKVVVPVIFVSGHADLSAYCQEAGDDWRVFLPKPIDADALLNHVQRIVSAHLK